MITLTITLDDEVFSRLQARAKEAGVSVEEHLAALAAANASGADVSDEFKALTADLIEEYRPVFHRLAQ